MESKEKNGLLITISPLMGLYGATGASMETPRDFIPVTINVSSKRPKAMPKNPVTAASRIKANLIRRTAYEKAMLGIVKELRAVTATTP